MPPSAVLNNTLLLSLHQEAEIYLQVTITYDLYISTAADRAIIVTFTQVLCTLPPRENTSDVERAIETDIYHVLTTRGRCEDNGMSVWYNLCYNINSQYLVTYI